MDEQQAALLAALPTSLFQNVFMAVTAEFTKTFGPEEVATFFRLIRVGEQSYFNLGLTKSALANTDLIKAVKVQHTMFAMWCDKIIRSKLQPDEIRDCFKHLMPIPDLDVDALSRLDSRSDFEALSDDGWSLLVRMESSVVRGFVLGEGWKEASAAEKMRAKLLFGLKDVCSVRLKTLLKLKGTCLDYDALQAAAAAALDAAQVSNERRRPIDSVPVSRRGYRRVAADGLRKRSAWGCRTPGLQPGVRLCKGPRPRKEGAA
eukprot:15478531-Alexandrium_andersonii.AAC.1